LLRFQRLQQRSKRSWQGIATALGVSGLGAP
jgi:hypothetical protein